MAVKGTWLLSWDGTSASGKCIPPRSIVKRQGAGLEFPVIRRQCTEDAFGVG